MSPSSAMNSITPELHHVKCPDAQGGHAMAYWSWGDASAAHVVVCAHGLARNSYFNGQCIRLDGAIRMAPR